MKVTKTFMALGTVNTIELPLIPDSERIFKRIKDRIYEIDDRMSVFKADSDISKISISAGIHPVKVHDDTFYVIKTAKEYAKLTSGTFDITALPLIRLWKRKSMEEFPDKEEIKKAKHLTNYKNIILNEKTNEVFLKKKGQCLDLSAIAKGYAADETVRILNEEGVFDGVINYGGNIIFIGNKSDSTNYKFGIRDPLKGPTDYCMKFTIPKEIKKLSIVTSGAYENQNHIINPKTGLYSKNDLLSVSVTGECSMIADILSTALFITGSEKGKRILKKTGYDAVFINDSNKLIISKGINTWINY